MKWLFSLLLIANLGLFIWLYPQQDKASINASRMRNIGELRLVSELSESAGEAMKAAESFPIIEAKERQVPPPFDEPSESVESPPGMVEAPSTPPETVTEPGVPENAPVPATPVCGTIGEFEKRSQAERVSVQLLAQGAKTEITSESSSDQAGFWVLIPPQGSRQGAIALAKRLEAAGITDLWRFTSGDLAHAISLGLFRDEERARTRRDKIESMGFNPIVKPRFREMTLYRVSYRNNSGTTLSEETWREISRQYPEVERTEQLCPE